jgi:hypothetical protein
MNDIEMPSDPNADIIGKVVNIADREWTIACSWAHSQQYVVLSRPGPEPGLIDGMIRPVAVVRRHLQLMGA